MFTKIAVAFDESPEAARAFQSALELAKNAGAELTMITVIEPLPAYVSYASAVSPDVPQLLQREKQTFYSQLHHKARRIAQRAGVQLNVETIEANEIDGLLQLIDDVMPDLLVIGLRREPGGFSGFIGGTAHHLALHAKCNILGIR
ncbi:MAG: universal stress protein [Acidobacteriota bacterium]